jgi:hypothetical protein
MAKLSGGKRSSTTTSSANVPPSSPSCIAAPGTPRFLSLLVRTVLKLKNYTTSTSTPGHLYEWYYIGSEVGRQSKVTFYAATVVARNARVGAHLASAEGKHSRFTCAVLS